MFEPEAGNQRISAAEDNRVPVVRRPWVCERPIGPAQPVAHAFKDRLDALARMLADLLERQRRGNELPG